MLQELPEFQQAGAVLAFASFGSEAETRHLIKASFAAAKRVLLPVTTKEKSLIPCEITHATRLVHSPLGVPEPPLSTAVDPSVIDLVIVPGAVFDSRGSRIGYGAGYYDRFLRSLRPDVPKIAIAFDLQVVEEAPTEQHDLPVDIIVTENRVIRCKEEVLSPEL